MSDNPQCRKGHPVGQKGGAFDIKLIVSDKPSKISTLSDNLSIAGSPIRSKRDPRRRRKRAIDANNIPVFFNRDCAVLFADAQVCNEGRKIRRFSHPKGNGLLPARQFKRRCAFSASSNWRGVRVPFSSCVPSVSPVVIPIIPLRRLRL